MVKDLAGTTRDSIDTKFKYEDTDFVLIDTA
jgi:predicted GTPase